MTDYHTYGLWLTWVWLQ